MRTGPIYSSQIFTANIIMHPPPCLLRFFLTGAWSPFAHPSLRRPMWLVISPGKGRTSYHIFCIFCPDETQIFMPWRGWRPFGDALCFSIWPSILFHVVLRMSVRPNCWKILFTDCLVCMVLLRKFLFKLLKSCFVTDLRMPLSERVFPFLHRIM